jgi:hypothetical protein
MRLARKTWRCFEQCRRCCLSVGTTCATGSFCFSNRKMLLIDSYDDELQPHNDRVRALRTSLKWINVQATLLDICIAFYPLDLPPYVVLEIVDRFPFWSTHVNQKKKIDYIIRIKQFCDDLINKRATQVNEWMSIAHPEFDHKRKS